MTGAKAKASRALESTSEVGRLAPRGMSEAAKDDELKTQLDQLTQNPQIVEYFRHRLTRLKTLERLVGIAAGEEPAAGKDE